MKKPGRPFSTTGHHTNVRIVKCNKCGATAQRHRRDTGGYGECPKKCCESARMIIQAPYVDRKMERAREEMKKWEV